MIFSSIALHTIITITTIIITVTTIVIILLLLQILPLNLELIRPASPRDSTSEFHHAQVFYLGSGKQNPMLT